MIRPDVRGEYRYKERHSRQHIAATSISDLSGPWSGRRKASEVHAGPL